jgi:catechol 2,3-dioxygenase-like lactoylglutathione lyase family enzyme
MPVLRMQHASLPMPAGGNDAARAFYGRALDLREIPTPSTLDSSQIIWFSAAPDGQEVHLFTDPDHGPNSPGQHICLQVDDIEATRQRLADHDIATHETTPIHNRPRFFIRDPFGNGVELTEIQGDYS